MDYDVACQVSKTYKICPPASWSFLMGLDAIIRLRLFEFEHVFFGNRGVINVTGIVWGLQHLCHYVTHGLGLVFWVPSATVVPVYESHVSRAENIPFKWFGFLAIHETASI